MGDQGRTKVTHRAPPSCRSAVLALMVIALLATAGCESPDGSAAGLFAAWAKNDRGAAATQATAAAVDTLFAERYATGSAWRFVTCGPADRAADCTWVDHVERRLVLRVDEASQRVVDVRRYGAPDHAAGVLFNAWRAGRSALAARTTEPGTLVALFSMRYAAAAHWLPAGSCRATGTTRSCTWRNDSDATIVLSVDPATGKVTSVSGTYRPCVGGCTPHLYVTRLNPTGASTPCTPCLADRSSSARLVTASPAGAVITVDDTAQAQRIDGFGYAFTDSAAYLIDQVPNDRGQRDALMRQLFDPSAGIGLSWARVVMGASDFTLAPRPWYSYRPTEADAFSISRARPGSPAGDDSHIVPLLQQATSITGGQLTIFANPHSAPGWMKGNGDLWNIGGDGCLLGYCDPSARDLRDAYAQYFVDFVDAYATRGIGVDAVGMQNEPGNVTDYPGGRDPDGVGAADAGASQPDGDLVLADELDFAGRLDRAFRADITTPDPEVWVEVESWSATAQLQASPDRASVDGLSYHCYFYAEAGLRDFARAFPTKGIHLTECTQALPRGRYAPTIDRIIAAMEHAQSAAGWNLALAPDGGPQASCGSVDPSGCTVHGSDQGAPVTIEGPPGAATARLTTEYYEMGHFSKFVRPGARRIGSTPLNGLSNVAFLNPDGSHAMVVHNTRSSSATFSVAIGGGRSFAAATLAPDEIATFTW